MENKKIKYQIRNRITGLVMFEYESEDNTLRKTVEKAARGADLRDADLCGADLRGADLCGANLRDADLCDADLRDADLRGANLCDANLCGADLCGADLYGCVLGYNDDSLGYGEFDNLKSRVENNSNLRLVELCENHDAFSSAHGAFWKNLVIIRQWEVSDTKKAVLKLDNIHANVLQVWLNHSGYVIPKLKIQHIGDRDRKCCKITIVDTQYSITLPLTGGINESAIYMLDDDKLVECD